MPATPNPDQERERFSHRKKCRELGMSKKLKRIMIGAWLVSTILVFFAVHQFEVSSTGSDAEAAQTFKGYSSFIEGGYNYFRVAAVTFFGSAISFWLISFIMKTITKFTRKKTSEELSR